MTESERVPKETSFSIIRRSTSNFCEYITGYSYFLSIVGSNLCNFENLYVNPETT